MSDAAWGDLPEELRERVDGALRSRRHFAALLMLWREAPGPRLDLRQAQELMDHRYVWLADRGEIEPEPVLRLDDLQTRVNAITDPVVAFEAMWDGDSYGWLVALSAIIERPSEHHPRFDEVCLATLRQGAAAADALHFGQTLARIRDLPFFFASPDTPDIDLPRWWDTLG